MAARPDRLAAAVAMATVLACCTLEPAYHRPPAPVPATSPSGPSYPVAAPQPVNLLGWRELFTDPQLKEVIAEALANNRDLRIAVANIQAARAQYQVQRSSPPITGRPHRCRRPRPAARPIRWRRPSRSTCWAGASCSPIRS